MIVTTLSALVPAFRAGRLAPIEAMKGDYARDTKLSRMWILGVVLLLFSTAVQFATKSAMGAGAVIGILLGAVLVVPVVLRPLAMLLGRVTNRLARGVGDVAVLHLAKERSRSAYTLALVMVVMAMLFATGGLYLSVRAGIDELIDRQFGADLFVQAGIPDDGSLKNKLAEQPDVALVTPLRFGFTNAPDEEGKRREIFVRTIEPESYFDASSYFWTEGNDKDAKAALIRGGSVLVSVGVAKELDAGLGDTVRLETTKGRRPFKVAAIYAGNPGPPDVTMGFTDAKRYLSAGRPNAYILNVADGNDPKAVGRTLETSLKSYQLSTQTAADEKDEARGQVGTYFQIVYAILLIAAIVGLLGLANTLAMSVLHRFREIGILRAIGVTRSQAWRMVLVESATMGLTAFVLSLPLGLLLSFLVIRGTADGFGFTIPTIYPWIWVPFVALFALFIAVVAAIAPGRRAARLHVVTALQYE
jgi:putative ABC transport system permease protein